MIDKSTVDRIYAAANIVEVVSDFVSLKKKGTSYQACCPFHSEKSPSFMVSPAKGLFKCFGCGKGGNAVTFVMEHESMSYADALKYVARKYGIEVREREMSPEEQKRNDDRESMMVVTDFAAEWFKKQITGTDEGRSVGLGYFRERGFSDASIDEFGLGYCPSNAEEFTKAALAEGYKEEFLISTGLTGKRETGRLFDRFYARVIFPIHSVSGRVIAFGGRTLRTDKKVAKYMNSPESEIYHKSNSLYGIFHAKRAIVQEDCCILVEGYTDVISMHQAGIKNVVASSGTSLTIEQVRLISRFTRNVTMIFDGDAAGVKASLRGIDLILQEGLNVRVVSLPVEHDPDSFAKAHTAEQLRDYVTSHEEDFITFKTRILLEDAGTDPIKRAALITDVVTSISVIPDPIMRSLYVNEIASGMNMDKEVLTAEVARKRITQGADKQTREFIRNQQKIDRITSQPEVQPGPAARVHAGSNVDQLEKEIIKYLIKYGNREFDYKEGKTVVSLNVAELIINEIEANGLKLRNEGYRRFYDEYMKMSGRAGAEEGSAPVPVEPLSFINHPEPSIAEEAVRILTENDNYSVSRMWKKFDVVVEEEQDRLAEIVPRTVNLYISKIIEILIAEESAKLSDGDEDEEDVAEITRRIVELNKVRTKFSDKLSRLIL